MAQLVEDVILDTRAGVHRPRNVDWKRAAALLYGDWGTSKAYVLGLAFVAAGFSSFSIILAVCALTAIVGFNYLIICAHFPDGGGVYSAARQQSRFLASVGALLLIANFLVTAALSGWAGVTYLGVPTRYAPEATMAVILFLGAVNYFGPKHSGSMSMWLAVPAVIVVVSTIAFSVRYLNLAHLEPRHTDLSTVWVQFVGVILALSGVEAIANLTGVMKLDPNSTPDHPKVTRTASKAIIPVAVEVVAGTALLGWAMLSLPKSYAPQLEAHKEDMLRFIGEYYATLVGGTWFGHGFSIFVGVVFGLLLVSAVNTAIVALIGVIYMMAQDGEMPRQFARLNSHGVPGIPLIIAVAIPILVLTATRQFETLAGLYAIGVVGAISVNLGACTFNKRLDLRLYERLIMGATFVVLALVELTIAKTKPDALFFALCVLGVGLGFRTYSHKLSGLKTLTVTRKVAEMVTPDLHSSVQTRLVEEGHKIMVAARGITQVLGFALDEAQLRNATLYVLYVKEIAVFYARGPTVRGRPKWQDDPEAAAIMSSMLRLAAERNISVLPLYAVSEDTATTILDLAATLGIDYLIIGASQRTAMTKLLRGSVATNVATQLPDSIHLLIYG
ncbi:MAG TPA: amino acid permease [Candidatus Udaeobacter sp.]|jgi:amino acid transporter/nucleotide-binding universal stress UspA family protein|nr:amino acid permease [Candidatus Udaeobacter sp.]